MPRLFVVAEVPFVQPYCKTSTLRSSNPTVIDIVSGLFGSALKSYNAIAVLPVAGLIGTGQGIWVGVGQIGGLGQSGQIAHGGGGLGQSGQSGGLGQSGQSGGLGQSGQSGGLGQSGQSGGLGQLPFLV